MFDEKKTDDDTEGKEDSESRSASLYGSSEGLSGGEGKAAERGLELCRWSRGQVQMSSTLSGGVVE